MTVVPAEAGTQGAQDLPRAAGFNAGALGSRLRGNDVSLPVFANSADCSFTTWSTTSV